MVKAGMPICRPGHEMEAWKHYHEYHCPYQLRAVGILILLLVAFIAIGVFFYFILSKTLPVK